MDAYEHYLMGNEYLRKSDYLSAIKHFEISNSIDLHFKTYERLYFCYHSLHEKDKAFECIANAYRMNSKNDKTALEYAEMLVNYKQEYHSAENVLKDILLRNPSYNPAKVLLGIIDKQTQH